jgi:hypothetical protein
MNLIDTGIEREDIGYDATVRNTNNNELIDIGKELQKFIAHINKTEK